MEKGTRKLKNKEKFNQAECTVPLFQYEKLIHATSGFLVSETLITGLGNSGNGQMTR